MRPLLTYPAIVAVISLLMFSCAKEKSAEIVIIDATELENLMQNNQNLLVIDVRTADEVAMGSIPGSINIDINGPDFNSAITAIDPSTPVVVYCASGMRSKQAAERLAELKFTTVYDYSEGYNGWLLHY